MIGIHRRGIIAASILDSAVSMDPYWTNVALRLPMDGVNGATTIPDIKGNVMVAEGGAHLSTSVVKFGSASCQMLGVGSGLMCAASSATALGSGDFTIEGWLYPTDLSVNSGFFFMGDVSSNYNRIQVDYKTDGSISFYCQSSDDPTNVFVNAPASTVVVNKWIHIAATRNGGSIFLFANGALIGTTAISFGIIQRPCYIGVARNGGVRRGCTGYIDDFRLTKGVCRYTSAFTPPTAPYPVA